MFDVRQIQAALLKRDIGWIKHIEHFTSIDSSNAYLMRADKSIHGRVCITDYQTQGKGRRGRQWLSNEGASLMFSLGWSPDTQIGAEVSLVVGVAIADTLKQLGLKNVALKWPNDVLVEGAKLAGILLESRIRGERAELVIGLGLNVDIQAALLNGENTAWTDLTRLGLGKVKRQDLLIELLNNISMRLNQLENTGFVPIRMDWLAYHAFDGDVLRYELGGQILTGNFIGLDDKGGLMLETDGKGVTVTSGEVSRVRKAS